MKRKALTVLALALMGLSPWHARAELWRSSLHDLTFVQVDKRLIDPFLDAEEAVGLPPERVFEALPEEIVASLGEHAIHYGGFVATYLPETAARVLQERARSRGLVALLGIDRRVQLPWHSFSAGDPNARIPTSVLGDSKAEITIAPVPNHFLVQFAYPIKEEWITSLRSCDFTILANVSPRTFLVKASGYQKILQCLGPRLISWIDVYLTTDRVSEEVFSDEGRSGYTLQYPAGTDPQRKASGLPAGMRLQDTYTFEDGGGVFLRIEADAAGLWELAATDPDLLSVTHTGIDLPSDERQGAIIAGKHNGSRVTSTGYKTWLSGRGLLSSTNLQTVAIHDIGYDDGGAPTVAIDHHPDLENPERLVSLTNPTGASVLSDRSGHGTMVAGIIAGDGTAGTGGTGGSDTEGYLFGLGIAPNVKLAVSTFVNTQGQTSIGDLNFQSSAFQTNRLNPDGSDRATVANQSWNSIRLTNTSPPRVLPVPEYTDKAKYFDDRVIDAHGSAIGLQAMTIVFSAGNQAQDPDTGTIRRDSVSSPATAKNVITVGATTSYRPAPEPPLDCRETPDGARPPNQDALHIARIGVFSGRSKSFSANGPGFAHTIRIKPDVVAPAVRVFSTVPFGPGTPYDQATGESFVGCTKYYPNPPGSHYYTYGTGTSFAAPVVSGVAALKRKWFMDRSTTPSPSLIKAAIIATADTLGDSGLAGSDHRPSQNSGWGRVSLDRLTDGRHRFYRTDNQGLAVGTGQQQAWTRTIGDPSGPVYIVLAWSDPSSDITGNSQAPLKNNLGLAVDEVMTNRFWRGNNFRENVALDDSGFSYRFSLGESPLVDSINNVEAVFIPANTFSAGQQLTIRVVGENVTTGTQKFAIYAYNVQQSQ